jgi:peptidoglycan/LPS O-acetylase OafA/YrhL
VTASPTTEITAKTPRLHLPFIDGIRALAALFVVLCHAYYEPTNGYYTERWISRLGFSYAHLAVVVFIVVSGFCLMLPTAQKGDRIPSIKEFYLRRIRRIVPPYYAALILSAVFILLVAHQQTGTVWDSNLPLTFPRFVANLVMIHNLPLAKWGIEGGSINFPLWSIAAEFQIYLVMPLVVLSVRQCGEAFTLTWTILFGLGLFWVLGAAVLPSTPWFLALFAMGGIAARRFVRQEGSAHRALWIVFGLMVLLGVAVTFAAGSARYYNNWPYFDLYFGAATALLLYLAASDASSRANFLTRLLSFRPLVTVGIFSYSLYLIHMPLLHAHFLLLRHFLNPRPIVMFGLLVLSIPLIVGWAYLFFLAFERPFLSSRAKKEATAALQ